VRIESGAARALQAVIENDLRTVGELHETLDQFAGRGIEQRDLATVAYALHNVYSALENSFDQISRTFENHVVDQSRWHRELLAKMFLDIPTVRPAVFGANVRPLLHELLRFRHLFRHSYEFQLDAVKLSALYDQWKKGRDLIAEALRSFARQLAETGSS
jgi:hypothetical protein